MRTRIWTAAVVGLALLGPGGPALADTKLIGEVAAVDTAASTLSVKETGASQTTTFTVDAKTKIKEGKKDVALADLAAGRSVKIDWVSENGVSLARRIDISRTMGPDRQETLPDHKRGE